MSQTVVDLGKLVKQKYPGSYDDMADVDVGRLVKTKHPEYSDFADISADIPASGPPSEMARFMSRANRPSDRFMAARRDPVLLPQLGANGETVYKAAQPRSFPSGLKEAPPAGYVEGRNYPLPPGYVSMGGRVMQAATLGGDPTAEPFLEQPILPVSSLVPEPPGYGGSALDKVSNVAHRVLKSGANAIEGLTTPQNLGILGAMALAPELGLAGRVAGTGADMYFAAQQLSAAAEKSPEIIQAARRGDYGAMYSQAADALISGGMGALAAGHAFRGLPAAIGRNESLIGQNAPQIMADQGARLLRDQAMRGKAIQTLRDLRERQATAQAQIGADVRDVGMAAQQQRQALAEEAGRIGAPTRLSRDARRASLEVPETTTPEDPTQWMSDEELDALTKPGTPPPPVAQQAATPPDASSVQSSRVQGPARGTIPPREERVDRIRGSIDVPLTPEGLTETRRLAATIASKGGLDAVITSDKQRTQQTAQLLAAPNGAPIRTTPAIRGMSYGELDGEPSKDAVPIINDYIQQKPSEKLPGRAPESTADGESFNQYKKRVLGLVQSAMQGSEANPASKLGIVVNGRTIKTVQGWLEAGMKPNFEIDTHPVVQFSEDAEPVGSVFWLHPSADGWKLDDMDGLKDVNQLQGGIYLIRHGETELNGEIGKPGSPVKAPESGQAVPPMETPAVQPERPPSATVGEPGAQDIESPTQFTAPHHAFMAMVQDDAHSMMRQFAADARSAGSSKSLIDFLRDRGGVRDEGGDLASREANKQTARFQKNLIQTNGLAMDKAREAAAEAGYLPEGATLNDFIDAIDGELRGTPRFSMQDGSGIHNVKEGSPLEHFKESPAQLALAIQKGSGKLFEKIQAAYEVYSQESHGPDMQRYLVQSGDYGPAPAELLGSDVPALQFGEGSSSAEMGRTEQEALTKAAAGRRPELLKEGKIFDETGLVNSPLFGGRGGRQEQMFPEDEGNAGFTPGVDFAKAVPSQIGADARPPKAGGLAKLALSISLRTAGQTLREIADPPTAAAREIADQVRQTLVPAGASEPAEKMGLVVRRGAADLAARQSRARYALEEARKYFRAQTPDRHLNFIDAMESGDTSRLPAPERGFADTLRELLDSTWEQVRQRNGQQSVIEHYFPHLWKDPKQASEVLRNYFARRPLEGSKSFQKKRSLMSVREGMDAGLELSTTNPVELTLAQLYQENKFIAGHDMIEEMKQLGVLAFRKDRPRMGEGLAQINDPLGTVYGKPTVTVKEAYDEGLFNQLNEFARSVGIEHFRKVNIGQGPQMAGAWGYTKPGTNKVWTKFGGPETVLTHEIGHQLDYRYGLADRLTRSGDTAKELRALADMRFEGQNDVEDSYKQYVRRGSEKIANLIHAMIHAPEMAEQIAPQSVQAVRELAMMNPELKPLLDIKPSLVLGSNEAEVPISGRHIEGYYYAPEAAARVLNNYLGPGLAGNALYDTFRKIGNSLNQVQLGLSGYHFSFTSVDAAVSMLSTGLLELPNRPVAGAAKLLGGLANLGPIGVAPWYTLLEGSKVLKEFYRPGSQGEYYAKVIQGLEKAGGRVNMDGVYDNSAITKFWDAWAQGKKSAAIQWLPAILEWTAKPLMQYWVPRQKLGSFAMLSQAMLARLPEDADPLLQRKVLAQAWDSVDNRMGQVVYDNLFWSRTLKDLGMISVRSLGWSLGTWRELGGAGLDTAKAIGGKGNAFQSGRFQVTPRMAYALALPIQVGLQGAMLMYLMTGKGPQSPIDYYFPQTGNITPTGQRERISLPSYMKDLYAYKSDFFSTIGHKAHPEIAMMIDMLKNKDFYGTEIRHKDDPILQQVADDLGYMAKQYVPFSMTGMQQRLTNGASPAAAAGSFFGFMPAPKSVTQTPAEKLAAEYAGEKRQEGGRTKQQFERAQKRNEIIRAFQAGDPTAEQQQSDAAAAGQITSSDKVVIKQAKKQTPFQRMVGNADLEQLLNLWDAGNEDERKALRPLLQRRQNSRALTPQEKLKLEPRVRAALAASR